MPTLIFNEIECIRTKEAKDDEIYINLRTESIYRYRNEWGGGFTPLWGPHTMENDDRVSLRGIINPIEFYEYAHIGLMEEDRFPLNPSNLIGEFTIRRYNISHRENYPIVLPRGLYGPNHQCYRITYDLLEEPLPQATKCIEFLVLECNNAQGTKDRISLIANNRVLWGPHVMRTNDIENFENLRYTFHNQLTVELYDDRMEKWSDFMHIGEDVEVIRRGTHVFARDRGVSGDYRYTLKYRVRQLPAS